MCRRSVGVGAEEVAGKPGRSSSVFGVFGQNKGSLKLTASSSMLPSIHASQGQPGKSEERESDSNTDVVHWG